MNPFTTFTAIEKGVIAMTILWPARALPLGPDLEVADFAVPLHRHAFTAVRELEAAAAPIHVLAVADAMHARAVVRGGARAASDVDVVCELGLLLLDSPHYRHGREIEALFPQHVRHLRTLRASRELLWRAS